MRKFLLLPVIFITAMFFYSCQKGVSDENVIQPNQEINAKVNGWLDSKQSTNEPRNERVEKIRANLGVSRISIEDLNEGEKFIIVPLKNGFIANTNKEQNPINSLLLVMDKAGKVYKGNLVQYIPESRQANSVVPANTFNKMFNDKKIDASGRFAVLSIFDKFLYEKVYKNGSLTAFKEIRPENNQTTSVTNKNQEEVCVDWFRHTTYYYSDGHTETTTEFLYTLCYGTCPPNEMCDHLEGGGGGGGSNSVDYKYDVQKQTPWWVVHTITHGGGTYTVNSFEVLRGKRNANEQPYGGHFTNVGHGWSQCNCTSGNYTYSEEHTDLNGNGGGIASARVYFEYWHLGIKTENNGFKSLTFAQIFP
ncbi:MAG: hypothetical protein SGI96_05125 [Bacteroidota bacterium]|nr:hypothetical protein [Bacteroidota bacterium]